MARNRAAEAVSFSLFSERLYLRYNNICIGKEKEGEDDFNKALVIRQICFFFERSTAMKRSGIIRLWKGVFSFLLSISVLLILMVGGNVGNASESAGRFRTLADFIDKKISMLSGTSFDVQMEQNEVLQGVTGVIVGIPAVVLLMVLFYVVFGKFNTSGIVVSIIAFTLTFGTSVFHMLETGTGAVESGQTEGAYALGFSDNETFFLVILPQALMHILPIFRGELVSLLKATAVVGYIAVQDLTRATTAF